MSASERRISPPAAKPLRYQETCLRNSLQPRSSPRCWTSSSACRRIIAATSPRPGRVATCSPANAAARSRNSQGRPRQPRPTTTPAAPVSSTIRSASAASQMSPLPSTGMSTCATSGADRVPVGPAGVGLRDGPAVQRDRRAAGLLGDPAGVEVGQVVLVDALAGLHRHRHVVRRRGGDRRLEDPAEQTALPRQRSPAALAGHLGDRAAEVEVDVLDAVLGAQDLGRLADVDRVGAVELDRPHRLELVEDQHPQRHRVPLDDARGW